MVQRRLSLGTSRSKLVSDYSASSFGGLRSYVLDGSRFLGPSGSPSCNSDRVSAPLAVTKIDSSWSALLTAGSTTSDHDPGPRKWKIPGCVRHIMMHVEPSYVDWIDELGLLEDDRVSYWFDDRCLVAWVLLAEPCV